MVCGRPGGGGLYLQDVIVRPSAQGEGLGRFITDRLMEYVHDVAGPGTFVGLMAARGVESFYRRWGFRPRPEDGPGMELVIE